MNIAIVLSGGVGLRLGGEVPKQYIIVDGYPIIYYCLDKIFHCPNIDGVIIGVADEWQNYVDEIVRKFNYSKPVWYSSPGETRQYSIYNALKIAKEQGVNDNAIVIIHDAARPLVGIELLTDCLKACESADGVLPVIPVKDTIYQSKDGFHITNLLNRNELYAGQAPEAFRFGKYFALHEQMSREELLKINGSTEIAYRAGLNVKLICGDEMNFKITTPEDLTNFETIIKHREK